MRTKIRDGTVDRPDIHEAIQMRMAMVLGGGYPERERQASAEDRASVFERAGGRCEKCGRLLDFDRSTGDPDAIPTIQHVMGNLNDPCNLKAFCRRCNMADAQSRFVPVEVDSPEADLAEELVRRWSSPTPLRFCDDDVTWTTMWRQLAREAKEVLRRWEEGDEASGDDDLPDFIGRTEQGTPIQEL